MKMFIRAIKILIAFNLIALITALSCNLNLRDPKWLHDWHLLVIKVSNNNYQLLRTNTVAANSDLLMFCNKEPRIITARCQPNGKFDKKLPPKEQCKVWDNLKAIKVQQKVSYCPHDLYRIGFNIEVDKNTHFLEAYQVCFDRQHMKPLFVINRAYPNADDRPDFLKFSPDEIFYGDYFKAFNRGNTFDRFKRLLGNQQTPMNRSRVDHIIDRGHMAPSGDFITTNLKNATFSMINVMPQFNTIDNGNWRIIEEWTRRPAHTGNRICTGVLYCNLDSRTVSERYCVLQLKGEGDKMVPIFLADNRKIPIPLWTYKIIKQQSTVFLTLNNIYHKGTVSPPVEFCSPITCPRSISLGRTIAEGITFCCKYNEFINKNVPYLRNVC
ncbi:hypothetical protein DOY81_005487 [Sarcophaga bullata]|nr:hypothetical protein DOY81_005487 [Sarcophaga bullata]